MICHFQIKNWNKDFCNVVLTLEISTHFVVTSLALDVKKHACCYVTRFSRQEAFVVASLTVDVKKNALLRHLLLLH